MLRSFFLREMIFLSKPGRLLLFVILPAFGASLPLFLPPGEARGLLAGRLIAGILTAAMLLAGFERDRKNSVINMIMNRRQAALFAGVKVIFAMAGTFLFAAVVFIRGVAANPASWDPWAAAGSIYASLMIALTAALAYCITGHALAGMTAAAFVASAGYAACMADHALLINRGPAVRIMKSAAQGLIAPWLTGPPPSWIVSGLIVLAAFAVLSPRFREGET